jgi:D-3-phosphoglycerate dehydrogenase
MKIAIAHDYSDAFRRTEAFRRLQGHDVLVHTGTETEPARLGGILGEAEALVLTQQRLPLTRELVARLPRLKLVAQTGRNVAHVDVAACRERGILVSAAAPAGGSPYSPTAELTWGLIVAALRHLPYEIERLKQGHWLSTTGTSLAGKRLGIYAFGHIGAAVARVGRAFGMQVVCWGREGSTARARAEGFAVAPGREAFFEGADVLSLHLPANAQTRGIVTAGDLARMKPTALLVNTSRAAIIEPGALEAALKSGRPGFAAVDVYEEEPVVNGSHPLLRMRNVLCAPHLGYVVQEGLERLYAIAADQILAFAAGKPIDLVG